MNVTLLTGACIWWASESRFGGAAHTMQASHAGGFAWAAYASHASDETAAAEASRVSKDRQCFWATDFW